MFCALLDEYNLRHVWVWKVFMFIFQLVQCVSVAVVGSVFASDFEVDVYVSSINVSGTLGSHFVSEHDVLFTLSLFWLYLFVPIVTASHYFTTLTFWDKEGSVVHYVQSRENKFNLVRWVEYSLSASLMTLSLALLCCVTDFSALFGLVSVNIAVQMFGYLSEYTNRAGAKEFNRVSTLSVLYDPFVCGMVVFLISWCTSCGTYFFYNVLKSDPPAFVYATFFALTLLYLVFPLVHVRVLNRSISFERADIYYDVLSLTSKLALDWLIIGGLIGW